MTLRSVLSQLAVETGRIPWDAWLTLVVGADTDEEVWDEAWSELAPEARASILTRLALDAGPLADALAQILAKRGDVEPDQLLRETLHQDAADAAERTSTRLASLRDRLSTHEIPSLREHLGMSADIERLSAERERLHAELAANPDHQLRTELEQEIARLKAFQASLLAYDRPGREAVRSALAAETEALVAARTATERRIREAQDAQASTRNNLQERESHLQVLQSDLTGQRDLSDRLAADVQSFAEEASRLRVTVRQLELRLLGERQEISELSGEEARMERSLDDAKREHAELRRRVGDLLPEWTRAHQDLIEVAQQHAVACDAAAEDLRRTNLVHARLLAQLESLTAEHPRGGRPNESGPVSG